jgi:hypothetical protein
MQLKITLYFKNIVCNEHTCLKYKPSISNECTYSNKNPRMKGFEPKDVSTTKVITVLLQIFVTSVLTNTKFDLNLIWF